MKHNGYGIETRLNTRQGSLQSINRLYNTLNTWNKFFVVNSFGIIKTNEYCFSSYYINILIYNIIIDINSFAFQFVNCSSIILNSYL